MAESFLRLIRREQEHAQAGRPAHIVAKMNALLEPSIIEALYQASQAGVEIDLIIRGLSILRPGVKGLSERIRVRSIVGRFLEHSRIFHFANGGNDEIYLGSADWMPRNLFERCEVVFPGARSGGDGAHSRRNSARLPGRHRQSPPPAARWQLRPRQQVDQRRAALFSQDFLMQLAEGKTDLDAIPAPAAAPDAPSEQKAATAAEPSASRSIRARRRG